MGQLMERMKELVICLFTLNLSLVININLNASTNLTQKVILLILFPIQQLYVQSLVAITRIILPLRLLLRRLRRRLLLLSLLLFYPIIPIIHIHIHILILLLLILILILLILILNCYAKQNSDFSFFTINEMFFFK